MTFFKKYFNWLFIALCVAGVYYGKLSAGAWLLLFSAGVGRKEWVDIAQSNLEVFIKEHGIKNDAIIQTPE